jgi:pimeloyl-ACP methyl ester carboxylesterase
MKRSSSYLSASSYHVHALLFVLALTLDGCRPGLEPQTDFVPPTPQMEGITREQRQVRFISEGVTLAGELDLPLGDAPAPLVFVIHHSGPVTRDAYGYLAELLVKQGYAVFRFDKRGTGLSEGEYGCCESEDALAAYRAAVTQDGIDARSVFIVAQSIGTQHLAERFEQYTKVHPPRGVVLLSSLLDADSIGLIAAPIHIIISDSETNIDAIGPDAAEAHNDRYSFGASYYVAEHTEHNLFDISTGPIDWNDPEWVQRYHRGAMESLIDWLDHHRAEP